MPTTAARPCRNAVRRIGDLAVEIDGEALPVADGTVSVPVAGSAVAVDCSG